MTNMAEEHPSSEILERFLLAQLPASETRRVLRHLLTGCVRCQEIAAHLWEVAPATTEAEAHTLPRVVSSLDAAYDEVLDRVFKRVGMTEVALAREREQALGLCGELLRHPVARQRLLVTNSPRFRTRAVCERLLEESQEAGFQLPTRALELAEVAVRVGELLEAEGQARESLSNLQARSWAQLANARRINSDHSGAEQAFEKAEALLCEADGVGLLDRARVFDLKASLRRDQRRLPEALALMDAVIGIYRNLGQVRNLGRSLAQKAVAVMEATDGEAAISLLHRALELLDPQEEPRAFLGARHNLIYCLNASGRHREAFALLFQTRSYYLQAGDRMNLLRLRWVEGQVAAGLGRGEQAEVAFREVREAFMGLGLVYDAALATLDLAALYADQGRASEVLRLTEEILGVFRERNIHREAIAAVLVLQQAAEREQARMALVQEVAGFLRQARNNPDLRFTRGS